jgi:cation transport ATPase
MMTLIGSLSEPNTGVVREKSSVPTVVSDSNTSTLTTTELDTSQLSNDANTSTIISSVLTEIKQKHLKSTKSKPETRSQKSPHHKKTKKKKKKDSYKNKEGENQELKQQNTREYRKKRRRSEENENQHNKDEDESKLHTHSLSFISFLLLRFSNEPHLQTKHFIFHNSYFPLPHNRSFLIFILSNLLHLSVG